MSAEIEIIGKKEVMFLGMEVDEKQERFEGI